MTGKRHNPHFRKLMVGYDGSNDQHTLQILYDPAIPAVVLLSKADLLMAKRLASMMGEQLARSLSAYHLLLYDSSERTLSQNQRNFDAYANSYRHERQVS